VDMWERLSHAIDEAEGRDSKVAELSSLLTELEASREGSSADRLEVKSVAVSLLAELGSRPLAEAVVAAQSAGTEGRKSWPGLYLAHAALAAGDAELALVALSQVDVDYFNAEGLHFRAVETRVLEAEAQVLAGDLPRVAALIRELNAEYRAERIPDGLYSLSGLARLMLATPGFGEALGSLFAGLEVTDWVRPELADQVAKAGESANRPV
jgi:hypothetical protein